MKRNRSVLLFVMLAGMVFSLPAEEAAGIISYATGQGFQVVDAEGQQEYYLKTDVVEGLELFPGDFVNTYDGTFLEIELEEERHSIKISENTSFRFSPAFGEQEKQFEVTFGRVRARVSKLAGLEKFAIQGPSGVAGVRGTDFGYDVLFDDPASPPMATIYCFEGQIEVRPSVQISASSGLEKEVKEQLESGEAATLIINAGEMLVLRERTPGDAGADGEAVDGAGFILEKSGVDEEISDFWEMNDFQETEKLEGPAPPKIVVEEKEEEAAPVVFTKSKFFRASALTAGLGTAFGIAAATFYYADPLFEDMNQDVRDNLSLSMGIAAGIFLSTSLFTLLAGALAH